VPEGDIAQTSLIVKLPKEQIKFNNTPVTIIIKSGQEILEEKRTSFIGPVYKKEG
jgi:hypothetical protein